MLSTLSEPVLAEVRVSEKKTFLIKRISAVVFVLLVFLFLYQITVILLLRVPVSSESKPFSGKDWMNPYQSGDWNVRSEKIALHIHTDEVWYTPERHSVEEIESVYSKNGYSLVGISDYGRETQTKRFPWLRGFEWGLNVKKRHVLAIGGTDDVSDFFPVYGSRENLTWTFQKMRSHGSYVIIAHPKLHSSFSRQELEAVSGYNAIEVFSPYGDDTKILDSLLSKGRNVHCMASDDLHYFPEKTIQSFSQSWWKDLLQKIMFVRGREGESLLRYISTSHSRNTPELVRRDLETGSFFCVKKFFREGEDPKLPDIKIQNDTIVMTGGERYLEVKWIGENGEIKRLDPDTDRSSYNLKEADRYVRLEIVGLTGKILSNAIYRYETIPNPN
ncbi:phosphoesterase [Leptospira idonii]|uniref:Phosphoesterase n=1 Tax=Leptospira idonii TaxID=1193500 RepID=A0A4R9M012_9LEPT|nr:phosphoesterase [Leptospira idonii]TGN19251.1 phosphoesterase [Leptospira idonii]